MPAIHIAPSILSGDFANLGEDATKMLNNGADSLHIDVMDGHFVPNLTIGAPVVKSLRKAIPKAFFDCHLMVSNPEQWIKDFAAAGANGYTIHVEAVEQDKIEGVLNKIKEAGMRVGLSISPKTDIAFSRTLLDKGLVDMVLIMSVEPGFGGQKFMPQVLHKVKELRKNYPSLDIQIDGGIDVETINQASAAGANMFVCGSALFNAPDHANYITTLRSNATERFCVE